jgi:hypothetical protein
MCRTQRYIQLFCFARSNLVVAVSEHMHAWSASRQTPPRAKTGKDTHVPSGLSHSPELDGTGHD